GIVVSTTVIGSAGGAVFVYNLCNLLFLDLACRVGTHRLKHTGKACLMAVDMSGHHGAAADEHGGNIDPGRSHQKARDILVTVGDHDESVKLMGDGHSLCGIRDQISRYQRIFHADMTHGDTVADGDCRKYHRSSARHGYALLNRVYDLVQVHMPGYDLIIGTYDSNQRTFHFLFRHSQSVEQGSVGRL